ncbi:hypothetical protein ACOMHN_058971 [Nucella lapillus]
MSEQLTRNVCTLGNCEHLFCKRCVEKQLGSSCPVCETPAHARDAQVNKQLSNVVSVSLELARLLHAPKGGSGSAKGEDQGKEESNIVTPSAQDEALEQDTISCPDNSMPCLQDTLENSSTEHKTSAPSPDVSQNLPDDLSCKLAKRSSKRKPRQTTLTQMFDDPVSEEEVCMRKDAQTAKCTRKKVQTPQTRMRNRQSPGNIQKTKWTTRKASVERGRESPSSVSEAQTSDVDVSSEDDIVNQLSARLLSSVGDDKVKGRHNLVSLKNQDKKTLESSADTSVEPFRTPTPPRSGRRRSESLRVNVSSTTPTLDDSNGGTANMSRTSSSRRRSAPLTPIKKRPRSEEQAASQRKRRSMPVTPSSVPKLRVASPGDASPVSRKSSARKNGEGVTPRVKRNAKGETPLHVAAIKGDITAVRELLDKGSNPNVRDNAGWTPLHEAVNHGHTSVAEILLQRGAMLNMPGMDNDTPLHDAVANHRLDCVRLLVTYGAAISARNVHGKTALELARTDDMRGALQQPSVQPPVISALPEPEDAEEFRPLCFLGTALSRDQRGLLQRCATKLHAKIVDDYCSEVTHVISSVNNSGQCPRTLKYLHAVLGGKWIVSMDWISICVEYGQKVCEEPFEVPGSSTHPHSNAANKARINRKLQLPGLFDGCQVYLHGSFSRLPPSKPELTDLLHLGGAHLLTREPRLANLDEYEVTVPYHAAPGGNIADCGIFIVHDGGSKAPTVHAHRIRAVPASWIIECIATFSLPEPDSVLS